MRDCDARDRSPVPTDFREVGARSSGCEFGSDAYAFDDEYVIGVVPCP
jgi:hypothetical protein